MISFFIPNKKTLFLMIVLGIFIFALVIINLSSNPSPSSPPPSTSIPKINPSDFPETSSFPESRAPSAYNDEDLNRDFQRITAKKELSPSDSGIKNQLIKSINKNGYLFQSPSFRIEYVESLNLFMIEILSQNTEVTKTQATEWFKQKGITPQGICNLPVVFYLNASISNTLAQKGITFNPIPEGCQ